MSLHAEKREKYLDASFIVALFVVSTGTSYIIPTKFLKPAAKSWIILWEKAKWAIGKIPLSVLLLKSHNGTMAYIVKVESLLCVADIKYCPLCLDETVEYESAPGIHIIWVKVGLDYFLSV